MDNVNYKDYGDEALEAMSRPDPEAIRRKQGTRDWIREHYPSEPMAKPKR